MPKTPRPRWTLTSLLILIVTGCNSNDERLVELSEQANARQQAQNEVIARQSENTTELSHEFIDAESAARQEQLLLQQQLIDADAQGRNDLQQLHQQVVQRDADGRRELAEIQQQAHETIAARSLAIDQQRDALERERHQIAIERQRAPIVAEAVKLVGGILACLVPLLMVAYLIHCLRDRDEPDAAIIELLTSELVSDQSRLLPGPSSIMLGHSVADNVEPPPSDEPCDASQTAE